MKITMTAIIERQRARSYTQKATKIAKRFYTQIAKKSILFTYGIPRALLSNKIVFLHFCKKSIIQ